MIYGDSYTSVFLILLGVSLTHVVLYRTVYYFHTFTYYNIMFKTVLKHVVCIYHYMSKNKIDSDSDSDTSATTLRHCFTSELSTWGRQRTVVSSISCFQPHLSRSASISWLCSFLPHIATTTWSGCCVCSHNIFKWFIVILMYRRTLGVYNECMYVF